MWTDVFASPGWRTTGTQAANFLLTPPGWSGAVPDGSTRIDAPTPYVWIIGRTKTDGPADYDAVHKVQAGYRVTPLSGRGNPVRPVTVTIDPSVDMKTPPKVQADTMSAAKYFAYAAELLKLHPPHITDGPIIAQIRRIGIEPGKSFDFDKLDPAVKRALESAPEEAQKLMQWKIPTLARVVNGWSMNTDTMGVYGNFYLKRAIVTQVGLGANLPEDAIYPLNLLDDTGKPLDGANKYRIHFDKGAAPPVNAFWSITLYDAEGFQVANALNRFAVSSYFPFKTNADGSRRAQGQSEPAIPLLYLAKLSLTSETRRAAIAKAANMRLGVTIYANPLYEIDLGFEKVDMTFLVVHERLEQIPARIILHGETIFGRLLIERARR
jgi:hypothetical protein